MEDKILTERGTYECKLSDNSMKFYLNNNECPAHDVCMITNLEGKALFNGINALNLYFKTLRKLSNGREKVV